MARTARHHHNAESLFKSFSFLKTQFVDDILVVFHPTYVFFFTEWPINHKVCMRQETETVSHVIRESFPKQTLHQPGLCERGDPHHSREGAGHWTKQLPMVNTQEGDLPHHKALYPVLPGFIKNLHHKRKHS